MKKVSMHISAALLGAVLLGAAGIANATATLTGFSSSQPDRFVIPGGDLITDGSNLVDLPLLNFTAHNTNAFDTLSFTLNAAPGQVIREIVLNEEGTITLDGQGVATGFADLTVNNVSKTVGDICVGSNGLNTTFRFNNLGLGNPFSFSVADNKTSVSVTISNFIAAKADGLTGGTMSKTLAQLFVSTSPAAVVPLPPAVFMLGSSLVGLIAVGRRRKTNV